MENKKKDPIVMVLKEQRLLGVFKNDSHFKKVDYFHTKYFGDKFEVLSKYIHNVSLEWYETKMLHRNLYAMYEAELDGYIVVDWDRFFKRPEKDMLNISYKVIDYFNKNNPQFLKDSDKNANGGVFRKQYVKHYEGKKTITIMRNPLNVAFFADGEFFENLNKYEKQFFGENDKLLIDRFVYNNDYNKEELIDVIAKVKTLLNANKNGFLDINWDDYFNLKKKSLVSNTNKVIDILKKDYSDHDWDKQIDNNKSKAETDLKRDYNSLENVVGKKAGN